MADIHEKMVEHYKWCPKCKHWEKKEYESPCDDCLTDAINYGTTKPIRYEEATDDKGKGKG